MLSILKPGEDPALPSSHRLISLLNTIGKLFEKVLLSRILYKVSGRGLLRDEQFWLRPKHSTALQLARLVERVSRHFGEKRLTGAVFLDVAKGLRYRMGRRPPPQIHNPKFPTVPCQSYTLIPEWADVRSVLKTATSTSRMRAGVAQGGIISPVLFSLYVKICPRHPATSSRLSMRTS